MIRGLLRLLLGCTHRRMSRPITPPKGETYVVCLDCGKQFVYDWKEMRVGPRIEPPPPKDW